MVKGPEPYCKDVTEKENFKDNITNKKFAEYIILRKILRNAIKHHIFICPDDFCDQNYYRKKKAVPVVSVYTVGKGVHTGPW